jgi:hypothetical protein
MWRPAVWHFGLLASVAFVACWSGRSSENGTQQPSQLEASAHDPSGAYWCSIDSDDYNGPRFACVIKKVDGRLMLGKLSGSERIRGLVTPGEDGFAFVGELYCPWGDCSQQLHGKFKSVGRGEYKGTFREDAMVVRLTPAPGNAFGGSTYGGDEYGDPFGYGGESYGGASYGRIRVDRHIRPRR